MTAIIPTQDCSHDDTVCEACQGPGACASCGHNPACGFASITQAGVTSWLCHDDDHSCYVAMAAQDYTLPPAHPAVKARS